MSIDLSKLRYEDLSTGVFDMLWPNLKAMTENFINEAVFMLFIDYMVENKLERYFALMYNPEIAWNDIYTDYMHEAWPDFDFCILVPRDCTGFFEHEGAEKMYERTQKIRYVNDDLTIDDEYLDKSVLWPKHLMSRWSPDYHYQDINFEEFTRHDWYAISKSCGSVSNIWVIPEKYFKHFIDNFGKHAGITVDYETYEKYKDRVVYAMSKLGSDLIIIYDDTRIDIEEEYIDMIFKYRPTVKNNDGLAEALDCNYIRDLSGKYLDAKRRIETLEAELAEERLAAPVFGGSEFRAAMAQFYNRTKPNANILV